CVDGAAWILRLSGSGVFRKRDRDQVVDQADETRAAARLQPVEQRGLLQVMVRDQQVTRTRSGLTQSPKQPVLAAEKCGEAAAPAETANPALVAGDVAATAPSGADRRDKGLRRRARHEAA